MRSWLWLEAGSDFVNLANVIRISFDAQGGASLHFTDGSTLRAHRHDVPGLQEMMMSRFGDQPDAFPEGVLHGG